MPESHTAAWISWDHHDGMDVRDADSGLTAKEMMERAFRAGWELAGGAQRAAAVDEIEGRVDGCCGLEGDDIFDASRCKPGMSCWELKRLLTTMGARE